MATHNFRGMTDEDFPEIEPEIIEPWDARKSAAIFGTAENGWIPTDVNNLVLGIDSRDLISLDDEKLVQIYKWLGRNKEPQDIEDRIHAGLPVD